MALTLRRRDSDLKGKSAAPTGVIDHATIVRGSQLVVCGWAHHPGLSLKPRSIEAGGAPIELVDPIFFRGYRADLVAALENCAPGDWGFCLAWTIPPTVKPASLTRLTFDTDAGPWTRPLNLTLPGSIEAVATHMRTWAPVSRGLALSALRSLKVIPRLDEIHTWEAVDKLPDIAGARVDRAVAIPGFGVLLRGWLLDPKDKVVGLHVVHLQNTSPDLMGSVTRSVREDLLKAFEDELTPGYAAGFTVLARLEDVELSEPCWLVFVHESGRFGVLDVPLEPAEDPLECTKDLLAQLELKAPTLKSNLDQLGPAIEALWSERRGSAPAPAVKDHGTLPSRPLVSVIVPIYGRHDFIRYQLSQFAADPEFSQLELIYVLDDPRIQADFHRTCDEAFATFGVAFRSVDSGKNLGFAGANNAGAAQATAQYLLLLNSDVLPERPGWIGRMRETYRKLPKCGALGLRLLFEDGTVQHDGMSFIRRDDVPGLWLNDHPAKGLPPFLAEGAETEAVPAVTAACMLVERELYARLGGLDEGYILGDFEDSDLCLRLRQQGYHTYVSRIDSAYHLERQSQGAFAGWRHKLTLYNAWRQTERWDSLIRALTANGAGGAR